MKNIFLLTIIGLSLAFSTLSAQDFGLRIGLNSTNAKVDFDDAEIETDGQTNLALGAFVNIPLGTEVFSIQPEITYLNRGYSTEVEVGDFLEFERTVAYLDLGVLARLNFGSDDGLGFYVGAGPYYSYAISGTQTVLGDESDIDFDADRVNRSDLQLAGAAGVTINLGIKVFAEARYMGSLGNQSDLDDVEIRQRSIGLHAGVMVPIGG
ncbi:hypothetical protein CEQ90_19380 [Lewinellaceae bacterium SD302]|nr:hypothetical protein CEQ90_19380 [Lewinellaceae bacterium SD302]